MRPASRASAFVIYSKRRSSLRHFDPRGPGSGNESTTGWHSAHGSLILPNPHWWPHAACEAHTSHSPALRYRRRFRVHVLACAMVSGFICRRFAVSRLTASSWVLRARRFAVRADTPMLLRLRAVRAAIAYRLLSSEL